MGDHDQATPEPAQPVLQPGYHLTVQMVGGLVQDQDVCRMDQSRGQSHPFALTAGEGADFLGEIRQAQAVEHGFGLVFVQLPKLGGEVEKYLLENGGVILHGRILGKNADLHIGIAGDRTGVGLRQSGQDLEEGGFSGAVDADDSGFITFVEIEVHIIQQLAAAEIDGKMFCG